MPFELDEKFLIAAEKQLGATLPQNYRQAMLKRNGGKVLADEDCWQLHPIFDQTDRKRISRTCNHIIRETKSMHNWTGWPSNALAIGHNGTGDTLVFLQEGAVFSPNVYVWDHETGALRKIAEDFGTLILE